MRFIGCALFVLIMQIAYSAQTQSYCPTVQSCCSNFYKKIAQLLPSKPDSICTACDQKRKSLCIAFGAAFALGLFATDYGMTAVGVPSLIAGTIGVGATMLRTQCFAHYKRRKVPKN